MQLSEAELEVKVREQEEAMTGLKKELDVLFQGLQADYAAARQRKVGGYRYKEREKQEEKVEEIRQSGLGLMNMAQAGAQGRH